MMRPAMIDTAAAIPTRREAMIRLLVLAGPIIATMTSRTVMNFVDFIMVSQLGDAAQAAILPAGLVLFSVVAFGMGLSSSVNTYVAQSFGRQRWGNCTAYAWQGLYLAAALGVVMGPCWFLVQPLFALAGHAPDVQRMEVIYGQIGTLGIFPAVATVALTNFFTGVHRPMVALAAAVAGNAYNIIANYALIFGHLGFAPMGIAGAAWATLTASILQTLVLLAWMLRGRYAAQFDSRKTWRVDMGKLRDLVYVGLPVAFNYVMDVACWAIFTVFIVGRFGTLQLAANNIAFKLYELAFMPTMGLSIAISSTVGKAIGHRSPSEARLYAKCGAWLSLAYMGCVGLLYLFAGEWLAGLMTHNVQVRRLAATLLLFCAYTQVFDALYLSYSGALRGAGDTLWPAIVTTFYSGVLMVGGAFAVVILYPQWESYGAWGVLLVYATLYGLTMWGRFRFGPWERIDLMGDQGLGPSEGVES